MSSRNSKRFKLMEFIKTDGIVFQRAQLFSKAESDYYYDLGRVSLDAHGANLIADLM